VIREFIQIQAQDIHKHGYLDFVAIGNAGMRWDSNNSEHFLGSVANAVLRERRLNSIFIP